MKQRFTLCVSLMLMLLVWVVPKQASAQAIKCSGGMVNLDDVKFHLGCSDWFDVSFKGHPGFTYSLSIDGILIGTFTGSTGQYSAGTVKSKFNGSDTLYITQQCGYSGSYETDIFKAVLPPDLSLAGTYEYVADALSATNTPWKAYEFTPESPFDIPDIQIWPDHGQTWATSCPGSMDGKWTFGATVQNAPIYNGLDSLVYELKAPLSGSGTITNGSYVTINGLSAGAVSANIIAYSGSCTDTVMVMNTVKDGTAEPTVACQDRIHVSVDAQCMADLTPDMVLAGSVDFCMVGVMDSIVVKHANGQLINPANFTYVDSLLRIENASEYIHGPELKVEIHSSNSDISNHCWGTLIFEDKLPPILDCDTLKVVKCYYFEGVDYVDAWDCDPNPKVNLVNNRIITDCGQINGGHANDTIIKRIIRTFNAEDRWGNVSKTCTDTIDIRRLDDDVSNNDGIGAYDPLDINGLVYPKNYVSYYKAQSTTDTAAFVCDSRYPFADYDHDHIPDPIDYIVNEYGDTLRGAGVPRIDTVINGERWRFDLHPSNYVHIHKNVATLLENCKAAVTYHDTKLPRVGCVEKVVRTWTIREWVCGHETQREFIQFIEVIDSLGPGFKVPADQKASTNLKTCERYMKILPPTDIHDYCKKSSPARIIVNAYNDGVPVGSLSTDNGTFDPEEGGFLTLPVGHNKIEYNVFDNCHNVSIDTSYITIVDETAPVVICKEFIVVGIADDGETGNGEVWIRAESFDNGSYDDCGLKDMCVARMDDLNAFDALEAAEIGGRFTPHGPWWVPLDELNAACDREFAPSGVIEIHEDDDPYKPVIDRIYYIFRDDLCTDKMRMCCEDAGQALMVQFRVTDKAGNTNMCMVEVEAQDKRTPVVHCPPDLVIDCRYTYEEDSLLSVFGHVVEEGQQEALHVPSGYVLYSELGKNLTDGVWFGNCGADVSVEVDEDINECRQGIITRTFTVTSNNGNTSKCKQIIELNRKNALKTEDIYFPADTLIESCARPEDFPPEVTGYPRAFEEECSLIGWAYEDLTVRFNDEQGDACFKILREWTVIDWCKTPSHTIGTYTQVIKINDLIDPTIMGNDDGVCAEKIAEVVDSECKDGFIELSQSATDNCTDSTNLVWNIGIDVDNDYSIDITTRITGHTADLSGNYPLGTHRIIWEVLDQCGNRDVCEQLFTIRNLKAPTPICITTITGSLMPVDNGSSQNGQPNDDIAGDGIADGGMLTVWADEYNIGSSSHPCGYELVYSFEADSIVPARDFDCTDLGVNNLTVHVLAVERTYDNEYNIISSDFCSVLLDLDDNNNTCDTTILNPATVLITGNIHTESRENLPTVEVALEGLNVGASTNSTTTDLSGIYAFSKMPIGETYKVVPSLNRDILNGVSTLDLVLIQKHILGLESLDSPYKIIAGDVNRDGRMTAIDLLELRKVILGLSDEFTNNDSWRFVDDNYQFISPNNPLNEQFKETYMIEGLTTTMILDFVGIKVGDVNGNVNVSGLLTSPRSKASMIVNDVTFERGQVVNVPVSIGDVNAVLGYQFTLEFDSETLAYNGVSAGAIDMGAENIGAQGAKDGYITASWGDAYAVEIADEEAFTLSFVAQRAGKLSEVLYMSSDVTTAEIYNNDKEVKGLNLEFNSEADEIIGGFELFQNNPNPFAQTTSIGFMLPSNADATISIFDVTGKLIKAYTGSFTKGLNTITVDKNDLNTTGVLYYTLDTQGFTSTRRMVLLR